MVAVLIVVGIVVAPPLPPPQEPDSAARARLTTALGIVRVSLDRVRRASYTFRIDLGGATPAVLHNRAQRMHESCGAADRALLRLDSLLTVSYPARRWTALRREVGALRAVLAACRRDYDTAARWALRADSVRERAPARLRRLDDAMRRYTAVARP